MANMAPAIPLGIPLTNVEGEEELPPQEGRDATTSEARTNTDVCQRCARYRSQNVARVVWEDLEPTLESHRTEHTRDSVFNRLERPVADPNFDNDYDSKYERSTGSRDSTDLRARLDAWRAQREQQAENQPPVRATPKEERSTQM